MYKIHIQRNPNVH